MRKTVRRVLLNLAHKLEVLAKQLRGAADKAIPEKRLFLLDCEQQNWRNVRPCFVLSTGRCGTLLLNNVLSLSSNAKPVHEPKPELFRPSKQAYEEVLKSPEIFREVFKSTREEYLLRSAQQDLVYIETNNQSTFFAPIIRDVFPTSVFIHLVRHPADFVRSGIRRKWYTGEHSHDIGRIVPLKGKIAEQWDSLSLVEKNGWLWNETNRFIEDFLKTLSPENCLYVKAEDFFRDVQISREIYRFIGIGGFKESTISRVIKKPVNVQRKGDFPAYQEWSEEDRERFRKVVPLAKKYGYEL